MSEFGDFCIFVVFSTVRGWKCERDGLWVILGIVLALWGDESLATLVLCRIVGGLGFWSCVLRLVWLEFCFVFNFDIDVQTIGRGVVCDNKPELGDFLIRVDLFPLRPWFLKRASAFRKTLCGGFSRSIEEM